MAVVINGKTYEVVNGTYYLVATYGLAAQISGMDPSDTENKLLTKEYVSNTGCQLVSNPTLIYTDTMCVLYRDLEVDEDIMIDGDIDFSYYPRAYYTTTDGIRIIPNDTSWYSEPDPNASDYDPAGELYYSSYCTEFESIASDAFLCINTLKSYETTFLCSIIGNNAFRNCQNLQSIAIRSSGTEHKDCSIGNYAFAGCTKLKNLIIGSNVSRSVQSTFIGNHAFDGCTALSNIRGHDNISTIGEYAFSGCSLLNVLTLVNCTSFDNYAFNSCTGLNSVLLRGSATYGNYVFNGCNNISTVHFIDNANGNGWITAIRSIPNYNDGHLTVYIPNSSYDTSELTGVRFIEYDANPENGSAKVVIKTGNLRWDGNILEDIISETDLYPSSNAAPPALRCARIYGWLKYNLNTLTSTECERITDINFDTDYQVNPHIGLEGGGGHNEDTYYPKDDDGLTSFDEFQYFTNLHEHKIQDELFDGFEYITSIKLPQNIEIIGNRAFHNCGSLTSITIPNSVTSIGDEAFYECHDLSSVIISNILTSIGDSVFEDCYDLSSITIPNSVTSIGDEAFMNCGSLTSITIPNSVTSIGDEVFVYCSDLTSIIVENGNTIYDSRNDCNAIIETATNILIAGCENTIIPNSVTSIGDNAFEGCTGLTFITIPNSVTSIGDGAFLGCSSLTSVTIPNIVTSIGGGAFYSCRSLTSVTIGNSVTSIERYAFYGCSSLTSVTIPNSVTSIGSYAFYNCTSVTDVYFNWSSEAELQGVTWADANTGNDFSRASSGNTTIHIPSGMSSYYEAWAPAWASCFEES